MTSRSMTANEAAWYRDLGARIRAAREKRGLSQAALARMLERHTAPAVHYWEIGRNTIDPYTLRRMERLLGEDIYRV